MKRPSLLLGLTVLALSPLSTGFPAAPAFASIPIEQPAPDVQTSPLQFPVVGTLPDGRTFTGTVAVTKFYLDPAGKLVIDGVLTGVVGTEGERELIQQALTGISTALRAPNGCDVLNLDLGPLNLDVLGLVIDLEPVILDIVAQPGPGNLVGNLLCAVVSLLNNPLSTLLDIISIIDQINDILSGD